MYRFCCGGHSLSGTFHLHHAGRQANHGKISRAGEVDWEGAISVLDIDLKNPQTKLALYRMSKGSSCETPNLGSRILCLAIPYFTGQRNVLVDGQTIPWRDNEALVFLNKITSLNEGYTWAHLQCFPPKARPDGR